MAKPILVSGMQPSGRLHIGNYLGALKNYVDLQESGKYQCYFFIADFHALTESPTSEELHENIFDLTASYLAAGVDPKKSLVYQQSQIPAHAELMWIFNTIASLTQLEGMTQYKDKAGIKGSVREVMILTSKLRSQTKKYAEALKTAVEKAKAGKKTYPFKILTQSHNALDYATKILFEFFEESLSKEGVNVGLLTYPLLMSSDILLYDPQFVPVGHDQLQHLELTRTIARKFNARFGKTFIEPQPILTKTPRVMALDNPEKKMSKSSPAGCLFLDDTPEQIKQKVMRAVTDSGSEIKHDREKKPAISNLLEIYSAFSGIEIPKLEKKFAGKGYGTFKSDLAELISDDFDGFRKKKKSLIAKPSTLKTILNSGSKKAAKVASKKMADVKKKVGIAL